MNYNILRMSKCKKAKNPCKICLQNVTQKTGLKCQGACESWVHYACLNYTPGRIRDIKTGVITVNCPCPDCRSTLLKEFRKDQPFSCTNMECPANHRAKCDNNACPINTFPPDQITKTTAPHRPGFNPSHPSSAIYAPLPISGLCAPPLSNCGEGCKGHSQPNLNDPSLHSPSYSPYPQHYAPPMLPLAMNAPPSASCEAECRKESHENDTGTPPVPKLQSRDAKHSKTKKQRNSSDSRLSKPNSIPRNLSSTHVPGDFGQCPVSRLPSLSTLEQMCDTVGQLTNQINCLMNKMRQVVEEKSGGSARGNDNSRCCSHTHGKPRCHKPCFCPGNPGSKN